MEQERTEIDDYFKRRLEGYEQKPLDSSWTNISNQIPFPPSANKSKKPEAKYWLSLAASIIAISLLSFVLLESFLKHPPASISSNSALPVPSEEHAVIDTSLPEPEYNIAMETTKDSRAKQVKQTTSEKAPEIVFISESSGSSKKTVTLPDSSLIFLNKHSSIAYRSDFLSERTVEVIEGEVFFQVHAMKGKPFQVHGNVSDIEVLGTSFMVRTSKEMQKDELYVSTGKVSFKSKITSEKIQLQPAEMSIATQQGIRAKALILDENYAAWQSEEIVFHNTKLDSVLRTLENYYGVVIQVNNPEIVNCRFTGRFEKSSLDEVLQVLSVSFNLTFNDQKGNYILSGKGCK